MAVLHRFYCSTLRGLSGRVLDSRLKGRGFEPHPRHCVVSLSKNINLSLVLVQPRKNRPFITEILLRGHKESNKNCSTLKHSMISSSGVTSFQWLETVFIKSSYTIKPLSGKIMNHTVTPV